MRVIDASKCTIPQAHVINDMPSVVRYPRGTGFGAEGLKKIFGYDIEEVPMPSEVSDLPIGVGRIMRNAPADSKIKVCTFLTSLFGLGGGRYVERSC